MNDSDDETKISTDEKKFLFILLVLIWLFLISFVLSACAHNSPIDYDSNAICALDFKTGNCWVEKRKHFGMTFGELGAQNERCDKGPPDYCWFAITHVELARLLRAQEKLKQCEAEK